MKKIVFGAYDPLYPNGLMSIAGEENHKPVRYPSRDEEHGGRKNL